MRLLWLALAAIVWLSCDAPRPQAAPRGTTPQTPAFEEPHGADINQGRTPAEIFRSDCAVCHRTPQGLGKDPASLTRFLRQHYTTGEPQAAALAAYLASVGGGRQPAMPARAAPPERPERPPLPVGSRRPGEAASPAEDGLVAPGDRRRAPEQANRPGERGSSGAARRGPKPDEPGRAVAPARESAQAAKPADTEKPPAETMPARPVEPAPSEQKPAAPPPPEIPL